MSTKAVEKALGDYMSKLIYAVLDDVDLDNDNTISQLTTQSYTNLCKDKEQRGDNLKNRFTISPEVKQLMTKLFTLMNDELKQVVLVDADTPATLLVKLDEANADCYSAFMFKLASKYVSQFGATLVGAGDPTGYFVGQIGGANPKYAAKPLISALVYSQFEAFLKAVSWLTGTVIWHTGTAVNESVLMSCLTIGGLNSVMKATLKASLPEKVVKPKKPKVAKTDGATPASTDESSDASVDTPTTTPTLTPTPTGDAVTMTKEVANLLAGI